MIKKASIHIFSTQWGIGNHFQVNYETLPTTWIPISAFKKFSHKLVQIITTDDFLQTKEVTVK